MRLRARSSLCSAVCALAALAAIAAIPAQSDAQAASLAGRWQAGATSMQVAIDSWGKDCGPRPQSTQSAGGGSVQIEQRGQVVTIRAADRDMRSDQCWSPNPAMRKVSSTAGKGTWTTRCKTAATDPRQEVGSYALRVVDPDTLQYQDISHFDWRLNESTCIATITTTQTLVRHGAAGAAPQPPAAQPAAGKPAAPKPPTTAKPAPPSLITTTATKPEPPPCVPGKPARISLHSPRPCRAQTACT